MAWSRSRFTLFATTTIASAGLVLVALPVTSASATPRPTLAQAQQKVHDLDIKAGAATEAYNQARIALANAKKKSAGAQSEVERQLAKVAKVQRSFGALAASAYRNGGTGSIVALVRVPTRWSRTPAFGSPLSSRSTLLLPASPSATVSTLCPAMSWLSSCWLA